MKRFFLCSVFLLVAAASTKVLAQTGSMTGDLPPEQSAFDQAPGKLTGVVNKIDKYRNGLKLTIKAGSKVYQYSVFYSGHGPQTSLSVDKSCSASLKTIDDIQVADVIFVKLNGTNVKSLLLKERPADKGGERSPAKPPEKPNN